MLLTTVVSRSRKCTIDASTVEYATGRIMLSCATKQYSEDEENIDIGDCEEICGPRKDADWSSTVWG